MLSLLLFDRSSKASFFGVRQQLQTVADSEHELAKSDRKVAANNYIESGPLFCLYIFLKGSKSWAEEGNVTRGEEDIFWRFPQPQFRKGGKWFVVCVLGGGKRKQTAKYFFPGRKGGRGEGKEGHSGGF